jgi:ribosomal subunit interface protein
MTKVSAKGKVLSWLSKTKRLLTTVEGVLMRFKFSFLHMETSDALKTYAEGKVNQEIQKFSTKPVECHVTFSVDRYNHSAHVSMSGGDGFMFEVDHTCTDMYGSVDHAVNKLQSQLRKQKEKLKKHKGNKAKRDVIYLADRSIDNAEIDAGDILKFEAARRKVSGG